MTGITLVLGGGGFKGMAHVGVLRALQAAGISVDRVLGTSAGALIASSYCYFGDAERTSALVSNFLASEGFRNNALGSFRRRTVHLPLMRRLAASIRRQVALERMFRRSSAFGGGALRFIVRSLVPKVALEDLRIPLEICALDLAAGDVVYLRTGDLCTAVTASSAVPGFFPPVEIGDGLYCDAGLIDNLPVRAARRHGGVVVAVDLSADLFPLRDGASGMELLLRVQEASTRLENREQAGLADIVLTPPLGGRHWLDTTDLDLVVAAGEAAVLEVLPKLRALLSASDARRAV